MAWRRRGGTPEAQEEPEDEAAALAARLADVRRLVNRGAGALPVRAVVTAHEVADALAAALRSAEVRPLDIHTLVGIERIVDDHLPTAVRGFLAVDRPTGVAVEHLQEALDQLLEAAEEQLASLRARDVDAQRAINTFLHDKFSRSDLEL